MFWFRIAILCALIGCFFWASGIIAGIALMMEEGSETLSIIKDPTLNGTIACYVIILLFQTPLIGLCLYGLILSYKTWRNRFQMDHKLRHWFIVWVGCWVGCLILNLSIAIYSIVKGKDPQGQMGYMYEMFQKHTVDQKFVSAFERFQKDHNCCGLYGPDDWLIVQLRAPGGGGGGMFQSMDYGFQQNPSTGKCHVIPPVIPAGCGPLILKQVNTKLGIYGGIIILEVVIGVATACIAWYCFFFWLEKEVIVIPEDEISNVVIIEPESSTELHSTSRRALLRSGSYLARSHVYLGSRQLTQQGGSSGSVHTVPLPHAPASLLTRLPPRTSYQHHGSSLLPLPHSTLSRLSAAGPFDSGSRDPIFNRLTDLLPGMTPSQTRRYVSSSDERPIPLRHNSYAEHILTSDPYPHDHRHQHQHQPQVLPAPHNHHHRRHNRYQPQPPQSLLVSTVGVPAVERKPETTLDRQLKALGGKVMAEMHVEHPAEKLKEAAEGGKKKKKVHHPTLVINRKKPVEEVPEIPPGHHGQTGNLAEDIAEMSGRDAPKKIQDVIIPVNPHKPKPPPPPDPPKILGPITGAGAMNMIEGLVGRKALVEKKEEVLKKVVDEDKVLVKPHFLPGFEPPPPEKKGPRVELHHGGSEFGQHGNAKYLGGGIVGRGTTDFLPSAGHSLTGGYERAHYYNAGSSAHFAGNVNHAASHERAHLGNHERTNYFGNNQENHHRLGNHERVNYLGNNQENHHHLGNHERVNYLGNNQENHHHLGNHERVNYLGNHQETHYLENNHKVGHQQENQRDRTGHESAHYYRDTRHHRGTEGNVGLGNHERTNRQGEHHQNGARNYDQWQSPGYGRVPHLVPDHNPRRGSQERVRYLAPQYEWEPPGHERPNHQHGIVAARSRAPYIEAYEHNRHAREHNRGALGHAPSNENTNLPAGYRTTTGTGSQLHGRYLDPGSRYLEPGHHGNTHYLGGTGTRGGSHDRGRHWDPGPQRTSAYLQGQGTNGPGSFFSRPQHERSAYLPEGYRRSVDRNHRSEGHRSRSFPQEHAGRSRSYYHSRPGREDPNPNATVLYKNPKRLDDSD